MKAPWVVLVVAPLVVACGGYASTTRLVDGELLTSSPVAPQAYALYLEATIAEASGHLDTAREGYLAAAQFEDENPELWTRVADLSCRLGLASADDEFQAALAEDRWYAPAWIARSRCALRRGNLKHALRFARQAQVSAANELETTEVLATALMRSGDPEAALRQWVGYTVLRPGDGRGWKRLAEVSDRFQRPAWAKWASARLGTRSFEEAPPSSARGSDRNPTSASNQVGEAILREDLDSARAIATDHRLPQLVILEWALNLGRSRLALDQAKVLVAAYPESADVRVLALLAAARANDTTMLEQWSKLPQSLTALTAKGRDALHRLLREQCGMTDL